MYRITVSLFVLFSSIGIGMCTYTYPDTYQEPQRAIFGDRVELGCISRSRDMAWELPDGTILKPGGLQGSREENWNAEVICRSRDGECFLTLTIDNVTESYAGQYKCHAVYEEYEDIFTHDFHVEKRKDIPLQFTNISPRYMEVDAGESVSLFCAAEGPVTPYVSWESGLLGVGQLVDLGNSTFQSPPISEDAIYTCTTWIDIYRNEIISQEVRVHVKVVPEAPVNVRCRHVEGGKRMLVWDTVGSIPIYWFGIQVQMSVRTLPYLRYIEPRTSCLPQQSCVYLIDFPWDLEQLATEPIITVTALSADGASRYSDPAIYL